MISPGSAASTACFSDVVYVIDRVIMYQQCSANVYQA